MAGLVEIEEIASPANKNSLHQFTYIFLCLPVPSRPNTFVKFTLADVSKPLLANSFSPLQPSA